jgi:flagellar motility protein MotE (MotC chaperone)
MVKGCDEAHQLLEEAMKGEKDEKKRQNLESAMKHLEEESKRFKEILSERESGNDGGGSSDKDTTPAPPALCGEKP